MKYYNTTNLGGHFLKECELKALNQDSFIFKMFCHIWNRDPEFTASEIHEKYFDNRTPITSIRRSLTNLKNEGLIEKTDRKKIGMYGRPEHYYRLKI